MRTLRANGLKALSYSLIMTEHLLAACRTEVLEFVAGLVLQPCAVVFILSPAESAVRLPRGGLRRIRPTASLQAGLRAKIRLMFQAMVTRLHSPRAFSRPR